MISGEEKICPKWMVLQTKGIDSEPVFCINIMEVDQTSDNRFWAERQKSGFELVVKKKDGTVRVEADSSSEAALKRRGAEALLKDDVQGVEVPPVAVNDKLQPEGQFAGPRKPAILRTWHEAREYCRSVYPGGDLPTESQWEIACGEGEYCTASGELKHTEARFGNAWENGPVNVNSYAVGPRGTKNQTGNVWEWTLGDIDGFKVIRGGSWRDDFPDYLRAAFRDDPPPDFRYNDVGWRCVAPPVLSEAEGPQDSKK